MIYEYTGNPFEVLDKRGVGTIIELALHKVKSTSYTGNNKSKPTEVLGNGKNKSTRKTTKSSARADRGELLIGISGKHSADPNTISYYNQLKVHSVCVEPKMLSVAIISAAKATVKESAGKNTIENKK